MIFRQTIVVHRVAVSKRDWKIHGTAISAKLFARLLFDSQQRGIDCNFDQFDVNIPDVISRETAIIKFDGQRWSRDGCVKYNGGTSCKRDRAKYCNAVKRSSVSFSVMTRFKQWQISLRNVDILSKDRIMFKRPTRIELNTNFWTESTYFVEFVVFRDATFFSFLFFLIVHAFALNSSVSI